MCDAIRQLEAGIPDPTRGLPEEVFRFAARIVPMVNVDLLVRDAGKGLLLTWREDEFYPGSWHIPGGIVRYKETFAERIRAVAHLELGATVAFDPQPLALEQIIHPHRRDRGHFISLLFECCLQGEPGVDPWRGDGRPLPGQWAWHRVLPECFYPPHRVYGPLLSRSLADV